MGDFVIGIEGWAHILVSLTAVDRVLDNWSGGDWGWGYNGDGLLDLLNWLLGNLLLSMSLFPAACPFAIWRGTGELLEGNLSLEKRFQTPEVNCNHAHPENDTSKVVRVMSLMTMMS